MGMRRRRWLPAEEHPWLNVLAVVVVAACAALVAIDVLCR